MWLQAANFDFYDALEKSCCGPLEHYKYAAFNYNDTNIPTTAEPKEDVVLSMATIASKVTMATMATSIGGTQSPKTRRDSASKFDLTHSLSLALSLGRTQWITLICRPHKMVCCLTWQTMIVMCLWVGDYLKINDKLIVKVANVRKEFFLKVCIFTKITNEVDSYLWLEPNKHVQPTTCLLWHSLCLWLWNASQCQPMVISCQIKIIHIPSTLLSTYVTMKINIACDLRQVLITIICMNYITNSCIWQLINQSLQHILVIL